MQKPFKLTTFSQARIKLTAWYLLIIMLISLSFSAVIYQVLSLELTRFNRMQRLRLEHQLEGGHFGFSNELNNWPRERQRVLVSQALDPELIAETQQRLRLTLLAVNSAILIISGGLGYLLAGKTLKPIQVMLDEQNQFVSDASHELKTPLTALKTSLEVHQRDSSLTLKNAKRLIQDNLKDVVKLQKLTEGLLQLAIYDASNHGINFESVSIKEVVTQALNQVKMTAKKKNIQIEYKGEGVLVRGDFDQLLQLLIILLDNAIKYSQARTKISVLVKRSDTKVIIQIKDRGIGISEEDLQKIFDRFYRADAARSKNYNNGNGSYGLGLSIAKKIVEAHQGQIEVVSTLGKGSIFKITLPSFS